MNHHHRKMQYRFFAGMAAVAVIAFALPGVGIFLRAYQVIDVVIFAGFFLTGLTLDTASIIRQARDGRALVAALVSSLFLFPLIAYPAAVSIFGTSSDAAVGTLIIGVAPVTIASGMVMTAMARGNVPLSLLICVLCNAAAVVTVPFMMDLMLGVGATRISLPVMQMLGGLVVKVLLPTVLGQLLRPLLKNLIAAYGGAFSIFNQCLILMIILNALSSSADRIVKAGLALPGIILFMFLLHVLILFMNYGISRLIRLDLPSTSAFTIYTSQKTLTVTYLVWAGYFAASFPMALIPAIAYHIIQMIMDTFVADYFGRVQTNHRSHQS